MSTNEELFDTWFNDLKSDVLCDVAHPSAIKINNKESSKVQSNAQFKDQSDQQFNKVY